MATKIEGCSPQIRDVSNLPEFQRLVTAAAARAHQRTEALAKPGVQNRASMVW
jgi:hypothetical protein